MHKNTERYKKDPEFRARQLQLKKNQAARWTPEQRAAKAAYLKAYRAANKEKLKASDAAYRGRTKQDGRAAIWYEAKKVKMRERYQIDAEFRKRRRAAHQKWCDAQPRQVHYDREVRKEYGITLERVESMRIAQDGKCQICGTFEVDLHVDHCHQTNLVRGLLCRGCNQGLGAFCDRPERLRAAAEYLENHHPDRLTVGVPYTPKPAPGLIYQKLASRNDIPHVACSHCGDAIAARKRSNAMYCSRRCKWSAGNKRAADKRRSV